MVCRILPFVFLTLWVVLQVSTEGDFCSPYHLGLLENMTLSLSTARPENRELVKKIGEDLKMLGQDLREGLAQDLGKDLKGLAQIIEGEMKEMRTRNEEFRQERVTQHEEMMYVFNQILKSLESEKEENLPPARDCAVLYKSGKSNSGVYHIKPDGLKEGFDVFCDMEYDRGGWTVFQRRGNFGTPSDYFYKNWDNYKHGFGNLKGEHWLGNDRISALSKQGTYELHIEMLEYDHNRIYARYENFMIEGEDQLYKLHVSNFSGNDHDSMAYHNGKSFTTFDRNNGVSSRNCAVNYAGAWWYDNCYHSNLNSIKDPNKDYFTWRTLKGSERDLSSVLMKIRSLPF